MALVGIEVTRDREWLVIKIERTKRTRRFYLGLDEAQILIDLLKRELGEVETSQLP